MLEELIRKLSKSPYYQTLYSIDKNLGLRLFKNDCDYTNLQILFLDYLAFYSALYFDYAIGEIDEKVFEDFIYEDAYMKYRKKKKDKQRTDTNTNLDINRQSTKPVTSQWVFKTNKKRVN